MLAELVKKAFEYRQAKQEARAATFDELVALMIGDKKKKPTPAEIDEALEAAGKTWEDLTAALEYREHRRALAAEMAEIPAVEQHLDTVAAKLMALNIEREQFIAQIIQREQPLVANARALQTLLGQARSAEHKLRQHYRGPLRDELLQLEEQRRQLTNQMDPIGSSREHHAMWARPKTDFVTGHEYHNCSDQERATHQQIVADCDKQLADIRSEIAKLDAREREIQVEMARP
jgi:hypothetical protein